VKIINFLQSDSLERVSFYTVTTDFAREMLKDPSIDTLQITGHSLGGGLAIISGAQTHIPAVSLSGPNAIISGRSFHPKVTAESLNRYTFNIVPERDIVPRLDIVADQFQNIRCTASHDKFYQCHSPRRAFCEIQYTCGSGSHPAVCECATQFGYPEPTPTGNRTFKEACMSAPGL
jgi:lipase ATG15